MGRCGTACQAPARSPRLLRFRTSVPSGEGRRPRPDETIAGQNSDRHDPGESITGLYRAEITRVQVRTWFNRFEPTEQADFFALVSLYPTSEGRNVGRRDSWWSPIILLFTNKEMRSFMANVKTVGGNPDNMFGFGFSGPDHVIQSRGDQLRRRRDFSTYLTKKRKKDLQDFLTAT